MQIDRNVNGDGPDRQAAPQNIYLLPENLFQGTAGVALDGKCGAAQESRCGEFAPYFNDRERSLAGGVSGEVNPKFDYRRQGQKDHRISAAQRLFGERDPFRLRRTYFGARLSWIRTSLRTAFASFCRPALSSRRP